MGKFLVFLKFKDVLGVVEDFFVFGVFNESSENMYWCW